MLTLNQLNSPLRLTPHTIVAQKCEGDRYINPYLLVAKAGTNSIDEGASKTYLGIPLAVFTQTTQNHFISKPDNGPYQSIGSLRTP